MRQEGAIQGPRDASGPADELVRLVRQAQAGEAVGLSGLFARYSRRVCRFCLTFPAIQEADAADLVQEVFVRAFKNISKLREEQRFEGWLFAIARRRCLTHLKRTRRARLGVEELAREAAAAVRLNGAAERERMQERAIVDEEIERLPKSPLKEAGRLFYKEDQDTSAIASRLGVPVSTVTTWLSRFRARVRRRLVVRILELRGAGGSP